MNKVIPSEPDYEFWSKLDSWNFKDAALLLHGMDPLDFKHVQFTVKEVPSLAELKEPYKTFLLLKYVKWDKLPANSSSAHPLAVHTITINKRLMIPEKLNHYLQERRQREQGNQPAAPIKNPPNIQPKPDISAADTRELSTRERRSLLKAIGIMATLLAEDPKRFSQFKLNNRPNAFQIAEAALTKANAL